jgi:hypothetical protein
MIRYIPSLRRFMAAILLLWGLCDMTVPGICKTDFSDISSAVQATSSVGHGTFQISALHSNQKQAPAQPGGDSDDCWCCCSHIVPAVPQVSLVSFRRTVDEQPTLRTGVPRWRASEFFQPPKI